MHEPPLRVLVVFGTRPEAIKMAPVVRALARRGDLAKVTMCTTAQHREMLDQVLDLFGIRPEVDLDLMRPNQSPSEVAARVLAAMDPILAEVNPDWILVQGDTTTVMATAIAAHHRRVRVGHVEAGLRTYDRANPFPEEMNRVLVDHISDLHFAPTDQARRNLLREGIRAEQVAVTGNTGIDALLEMAGRPASDAVRRLEEEWRGDMALPVGRIPRAEGGEPLSENGSTRKLIVVTAHRRENHGEPLRRICLALHDLAESREDVYIVYLVHPNPNVWVPVHELLSGLPRVKLIPPADYLTLIHLFKRSLMILTDSGGIQEEAPTLHVPVLVLRETTERPEAVALGAARVVGTERSRIVREAVRLLDDAGARNAMTNVRNPYGDGGAAERIADRLLLGTCQEFSSG